MADRSVKVILRAEVNQFKSDVASAGKAARDAAKQTETAWDKSSSKLGNLAKLSQQYSAEMTTVGSALAGFGTVVVAGLGLATKAAISWESAWAGVLKTVDGTPKQLAMVEAGLRDLAKRLPATHEEIAAVAEAAGQLGIQTGNVVSFTETMINMGESTNLSAEEAATSLSRFMNIMGTSQNEVGRLGAAVVGLGNNFATTEREIVEMSMRIAGAGRQAGLTEGEVMGLATALSSVGIEAEAGGTAISTVMKKMGNSVADGGAELELFARVAGMSSEEFQIAWGENAAGAMTAFITGLGTAQEQGQNTNAILSELGITGIRESDALLRLSSASGVLTDALKMGNEEYAKGTALAEEAAKRYETAESKIRIAGNSLKDTAITIGGTFLPMIAGAAEGIASFSSEIGNLPEPVLKVGGALTGIAGTAALAGGGLLLLIPKVVETVTAVETLRKTSSSANTVLGKFSGSLSGVGKAAGAAAVAVAALAVAGAVADSFSEDVIETQRLTTELSKLGAEGRLTKDSLNELLATTGSGGAQVRDFGYALESVNMNGFLKFLDNAGSGFGLFDSDVRLAEDAITSLDQSLASFASTGNMEQLEQGFRAAVESASEYGYTAEDIISSMPELESALIAQAEAMGLGADKATLVKIALGEIPASTDVATEGIAGVGNAATGASESLTDMLDGLLALGLATLSEREALRGFEEAIDGVTAAIAENGTTLDISTEKGRANQDALDAIADSGFRAAQSMAENNATHSELQDQLQRTYDELVAAAGQFGITGDKADELAREIMGIPDDVEVDTWMSDQARKEADATGDAVKRVDGYDAHPSVTAVGAKQAKKDADNAAGAVRDADGENATMWVKVQRFFQDITSGNGKTDSHGNRNRRAPGGARYYGGIDVKGMAAGGVMSVAQMVKPGEIRFAGDRSDVDEAWIPLDGSKRSIDILMEAIRRMPGFGEGMAAGGVTGEGSAVGGIPVPDTTPITSVWQQMFDQMLATTTAGWAAQTALWATSTQAIQATTLASQAAILAATQAHMAQMTGTYQSGLTGMSTLVGAQYALMQSTVNASLTAQRGDTQAAYQQMLSILTTSLSLMAQTNAAQWSGMRTTQHGHLTGMTGDAQTAFTTIRTTGIQNISALAQGIVSQMGHAEPGFRGELNDLIGVLERFTKSVNDAFGDVGVKLSAPTRLAQGGVMPGYTPGRDVHEFYSPTAGNLYLSGGEAIMRPEWTRAMGGEAGVKAQNEAARAGRLDDLLHMQTGGEAFASGGVYGPVPGVNAFADAGVWRGLWGIIKSKFPSATLNSAYRGGATTVSGNKSYHSRGMAVDLGGPMRQIFDFLYNNYRNSSEIIYSPAGGRQIKNGQPYTYSGAVRKIHWNHVHWANRSVPGGAGSDMTPGAFTGGDDFMPPSHPFLDRAGVSAGSNLEKSYQQAAQKLTAQIYAKHAKFLPSGIAGQLGKGIMSQISEGLVKKAADYGKSQTFVMPGGSGVERWRDTVIQALKRVGLPTSDDYVNAWLRQIKSESGGNPSIRQQIRDVNSGGNEAMGLVQVIPGTFAAFRDPSLPNDRTHPLANLVAGMNWAKFKARRQGRDMLSFIGRGHGYETGTHSAAPGWALVGENGPEYVKFNGGEQVANAQQSRAMSLAAISQPARMGGMSVGDLKAAFSAAIRENPTLVQNIDGSNVTEKRIAQEAVREWRKNEALHAGVV